jgi:acyl carrier protein
MKQAVRDIFVNELGIEDARYSEDLAYNSIPEWDSASHLLVMVAVEEKFGIQLSSHDVVSMTTIRRIYNVLQSKGIPSEG